MENHVEKDESAVEDALNESESDVEDVPELAGSLKVVHIFPLNEYSLLLLKYKQRVFFQGKLKISVLFGSCTVLGYTISESNKNFDVYSPRGHSALCFQSTKNANVTTVENLKNALLNDLDLSRKFCDNFLKYFDANFDSVLRLQNFENKLTEFLKLNAEYKLFPVMSEFPYFAIFEKNRTEAQIRKSLAELQLQCKFDLRADAAISLDMKLMLKMPGSDGIKLDHGDRVVICGGKGVGKSTLVRFMINKLLCRKKNVVVLDFDIGQSEFMICGCIGATLITQPLLGPNYTHLVNEMDKLIFIGDNSTERTLNVYMESIAELVKFCNENYMNEDTVWVVNTMGFTRSVGIDINAMIIYETKPSLVIQINSKNETKNYPFDFNFGNTEGFESNLQWFRKSGELPKFRFIQLNSSAETGSFGKWVIEARQSRELVILSYCSQILQQNNRYLTEVIPYRNDLDELKLEVLNFSLSDQYLLSAINGALVALCKDNNKNCIGFGIVRDIDYENRHLYLLTPVTRSKLESINCLVKGTINVPDVLFINCGPYVAGLVPYVSLKLPQLTNKHPKRNFRPAQNRFVNNKCVPY